MEGTVDIFDSANFSIPSESLKKIRKQIFNCRRVETLVELFFFFVIFMSNWNLLHTSESIYDFSKKLAMEKKSPPRALIERIEEDILFYIIWEKCTWHVRIYDCQL